jgi:hypothetical protein
MPIMPSPMKPMVEVMLMSVSVLVFHRTSPACEKPAAFARLRVY